ncbi:ABC transporter substrate-binding protein [Alysiella filiformis]|uniref:Polar amino acid transport system substrate-binding protein n=1 Tax=Alysiella filiformis DSM 16848 TaxID=1120981 RepID=A0A286EH28_9NEIS|nr:transporter substrate-binding domain-containing protein [Alysiella filiformis]QMT32343.1 amino acid ABC transporter substrate-binding protein [Alysiella filiformis]UBQ56737.1 transporter substrate-binding domain-containing protein [Alysiella filiformis DSM 16848]SOD70225.1 polar amino acid transport system substrate-binding protein [Alysiella filiformis DSM 16848]
MFKNIFLISTLSGFLMACNGNTTTEPPKENPPASSPVAATSHAASATASNESNPNWQTLMVATEASYPPFQHKDESGQPIGFEVELMKEVAKAAQFNVHIVHTERKMWRETLSAGNFDVWSSSFTISDKDADVADFSDPFLQVQNVVYVLDNEKNAAIKDSSGLKGKKISISKYSKSAPQVVGQLTGSPDLAIPADTFYLALKNVYAGQTDGVFGQDLVLGYYAREHGMKTKSIDIGEKKKSLAFVVKKGNQAVLKKLNEGLAIIKANGVYDALVKKYF